MGESINTIKVDQEDHSELVAGAISTETFVTIFGVIVTSEHGWQEQAQAVRSKVTRKLLALQRTVGYVKYTDSGTIL